MKQPPPHHVLIGTPAYGGMVHIDFVGSLLSYPSAGIKFTLATIGNESLITRARNAITSRFYAHPEYSHLLFLDADVMLPADGLSRLLSHRADIVAASVPLKGFNERGERMFNVGYAKGESGRLMEVERVGTAALLLSRRVVNDLVGEAKRDGRYYRRDRAVRGNSATYPDQYDIFRVGVVDGEYLSEDFWVCHQLRALGYHIYVDPAVHTRHQGVTEF